MESASKESFKQEMTEEKEERPARKESSAQVYESTLKDGELGLQKQEMTKEKIEYYARDRSVSSLVCGILALWTTPLAGVWFLALIPILLGIIGRSAGKKAEKELPPEQAMVAISGSLISAIALVFSLIILGFSLFITFASNYAVYKFFSIFR